ncbi:MAG: 3-oxoacyl-[acyl-carrier-protein] synthase, KASII [uncultured Adhaeribacter sp.]|uniref:3-oxoacyl-[acyl-carrier-protein] synthase, KASII n=1 Tax=uncultured Adhaeribacter sp. TaxID=448109 RepID=A0A6J4H9W3_9BACT|nr:MAG: 3-oxoacyl-[acyl-carrier-protein] synthase, KASII [uncultured Adhaeribacter sp.]
MSSTAYIVIKGVGSVSPLGYIPEDINTAYHTATSPIQTSPFNGKLVPVASLPETVESYLAAIRRENRFYKTIDRTASLAIAAARQAVVQASWGTEKEVTINIGSSRGATGLFEKYYDDFHRDPGQLSPQASPATTLGNISSWVARDLATDGPVISHSVTCSTALQAMANGFAWLKSGMANRFLAGAAEAPLTPFTVAQMQALGIYSPNKFNDYWCRPLNLAKQNTFVLGEGAAVFALERLSVANIPPSAICLEAIGFGFENIPSRTGISPQGLHFRKAMQQALAQLPYADQTIDAIVLHAPGTVAGDQAEINAIRAIFTNNIPVLTSNKMLIGHTLGASAALSLEYAINILNTQQILGFPYPVFFDNKTNPKFFRRILLLSAGFGGNAAALIVRKWES